MDAAGRGAAQVNAPTGPAAGQAAQATAARAAFAGSPVAPVPADDLKAHYRAILDSHEEERRRLLRAERGRWGSNAALSVSVVCLSAALALLLPIKRILPVIVHQHEDGSWTTTVAQSDVPMKLRDATISATLWLYVTASERYNTATHWEDQQVVYTLSDRATGDAFQERVDYKNKESPYKRYGTRTTVRVERVSEGLGCGTQPCRPGDTPNSYAVRYRRIEKTEGQRATCLQRQSTVRFRIAPEVPASQRVTYNPVGIQAVEYSWTDEGVAQGCSA